MKETGIVRKIDKMGRVVLPKELRWKYKMDCGDMVEIYTEKDSIWLKKYSMSISVMDQVEGLYETVERLEKELKDTGELESYLDQIKVKLERFKK